MSTHCIKNTRDHEIYHFVNSLVGSNFLLGEGFEGGLTERFCQDDVEEYFGYQRAQGRRADNPTAAEFGYNDLRISALRDTAPVAEGNVAGGHSGQQTIVSVFLTSLYQNDRKSNEHS